MIKSICDKVGKLHSGYDVRLNFRSRHRHSRALLAGIKKTQLATDRNLVSLPGIQSTPLESRTPAAQGRWALPIYII